MVVTAHPDDPEFGAGGTIAKLVNEGRDVTYVIVTKLRRPRDGEGLAYAEGFDHVVLPG